jgi:hypothetical protein
MGDAQGYTLVEVVVATLVVAATASLIMSVALTERLSSTRASGRLAAAFAVRRVSENLRVFVTADPSLARGPGDGPDGWRLPGDRSGLDALDAGHHDLDPAVWAPALTRDGGSISYDVTVARTPSGPQPDVTFRASWGRP